MRILIADNQWMYFDGLTIDAEQLLLQTFSVQHPRHRFMPLSNWDGWYRKYSQAKQRMSRCFLGEVMALFNAHGITYDVEDLREGAVPGLFSASDIVPDLLPGITLEPYQMRVLSAMQSNEVGIIDSVTGSGKTEIIAAITKLRDVPTLIIADIRIVIDQLKERLELRDISDGDIGLFYGGARPNGQSIIVGSVQSISTPTEPDEESFRIELTDEIDVKRYNAAVVKYEARLANSRTFQRLAAEAEMLLIDECDRAASNPYKDLFFKIFKGRYRYGFSGTPFDEAKPVEAMDLRERIGPVINVVGREEVQAAGRIIPIKFYMIACGEGGDPKDRRTYDIAENEEVIGNAEFHQKVANIVDSFPNDRTLILVDTHEIVGLGTALEAAIPSSKFIYAKSSKQKRNEAIKAFERGDLRCLIGGKILKRGMDLKGGAENVIYIGGGALGSNLKQIIGRAVRLNSRGWARVFAFYHINNQYLRKHSRSQLKTVVGMGYETTVIFSFGQVSGADFVRSKFRIKNA